MISPVLLLHMVFGVGENYYTDDRKIDYLKEVCSSELRSIVLYAFHSGPISAKIKRWTDAIESSSDELKTFVLSCVLLSLVHADLGFLDLCDILDQRPDQTKKALASSEAIDLVVPFDYSRVGVRSAYLPNILHRGRSSQRQCSTH
jgi:hypothetical protein